MIRFIKSLKKVWFCTIISAMFVISLSLGILFGLKNDPISELNDTEIILPDDREDIETKDTKFSSGKSFNAAIKSAANNASKTFNYIDTKIKKIVFGYLDNKGAFLYNGSNIISSLTKSTTYTLNSTDVNIYLGDSNSSVFIICKWRQLMYCADDLSHMFAYMKSLEKIENFSELICLSGVTSAACMFQNCNSLTEVDLSEFKTSNVTDMSSMFGSCSSLTNLDLSNFNTSNVTNMGYMFSGCSSLTNLDLSNFNTSKVTDMSSMFYNCKSLTTLNLSSFDTSKVTNMQEMFYGCSKLTTLDILKFDTSNVTSMYEMFYGCSKLTTLDLSKFKTSNVTDMSYMFYGCSSLTNLDLSNFDTSKVTDMSGMFWNCYSLTSLALSSFDTSNATNMGHMFCSCSSLTNLDLSNFDTSKVTNMGYMFAFCSSLTNLDLSNFNTSNVTNMVYMFAYCSSLTTIYVDTTKWSTAKVTSSSDMFYCCYKLIGGKRTTYSSSYTDKTYARVDGGTSSKGYLTSIYIELPTASTATYTYNGSVQSYTPSNWSYLQYTCNISNNTRTNAGTQTVTFSLKESFTKWADGNTTNKTLSFTINKASITIPSSPADKTYNGSSQNCGITTPSNTTASGTTSATNAGEYTATYSLNSTNYQWSDGTTTNKNVKWKINKASITIPSSPADKTYNGSSQSCGITTPSNTTASGTTSATNVGEYTATYSLNSTNYQWSNGTTSNKDVKWKIKAYTMVASMVSMSPTSYAYNGSSQKATAVVKFNSKTLTKDTDYTVTYPSDTTNIGTITVTITGKGNFTGSVNATYKIEAGYVDIPNAPSTFTYNGAEQTYEPTNWGSISSLCNISNNKRTVAGSQTVTISLKNKTGYKWSDNTNEDRTYIFTIDKFNISSGLFTEVSSQTYNGSAICPETQLFVSLKNGSTQLVKDTDYTLSYTNNTNAGTATITATGKGNFTGTKSINFVINKRTITEPVKNTTLFMYNAENQYYYPANWTAISDYCNITNNVMSAVGSKVVTVSLKDKSNNKWTDGSDTDKTFDFVMKDYWISYKTSTLSGSGTEEEPYKILCEEDLACLASMVNNDELSDYTYVVLMKNLNLAGKQWTPIGNYLENHYFNGSFDGNYHAIKNMKVEDYSVAGLFGGIAGVSTTAKAEIKNLILEKSTIDIVSENECYAGTITAYGQNLNIKNSNIFGNVSVNGSACVAGGFIGQSKNIMVSNCSIIGNISSTSSETSFVGGYIGKSEGELIVSQSYIQGNVLSSNGYTGGIFGYTIVGDDIVISECFTEGNITGTYTGGIAGYYLFNMINQSITNVYTSNEKIVGAGGNTIKITNYYTSTKYSGEFSSDYWFISSDINGGLPTLKGIYWIGAGYSNSSSEIISVLQNHGLTAA